MSGSRLKTFNYAVGMFGTSIPINMLKTFAAIFYVDGLGLTTLQFSRILFWYAFVDAADNLAYGLVVVMPSVGRSFYLDQPNGQAYFTCLVEELPRYLSDVFGLAPRPQCSRASSRCGSCRPTPTTRAGLSSRTCSQTCRRWKAALTIPRPGCSARHDWFFRDAEIRRFLAAVPGPTPR